MVSADLSADFVPSVMEEVVKDGFMGVMQGDDVSADYAKGLAEEGEIQVAGVSLRRRGINIPERLGILERFVRQMTKRSRWPYKWLTESVVSVETTKQTGGVKGGNRVV